MKLLFLFLSFASFLSAQQEDRTFRTLFLNGSHRDGAQYHLFDGEVSQKIELPRLNLSPVYQLRPGNLKLSLVDKPIDDVNNLPEDAPSVVIPASLSDFYLIVSSDPTNKVMPMRLQVVNASSERIGRGEMLWFNLTAKAIAGKIGSRVLKLAPGKSSLLREPATKKGGYPVELYFQTSEDERVHPLIESQWRHDPRSRSIVFVFDHGSRKAPKIMAFSDFRLPR